MWSEVGDKLHVLASGQVHESRELVVMTCGFSGDHPRSGSREWDVKKELAVLALRSTRFSEKA